MEWGLAWIMLGIAFGLLHPYPSLDQPAFAPIRAWGNDLFWATVLGTLSSIRMLALWRNGGWVPSPLIRATTSVLSTGVWSLLALGLKDAWILMPIFIGFIGADIYSTGRAATDARLTRDERAKLPEAPQVLSVPSK